MPFSRAFNSFIERMPRHPLVHASALVALVGVFMTATSLAQPTAPAKPTASGSSDASKAATKPLAGAGSNAAASAKDIVLDSLKPAATASQTSAEPLVATPAAPAAPVSSAPLAMEKPPANISPLAGRRQLVAPAVADLGLQLMRHTTLKQGNTRSNFVVSPYSVAVTLGMLHEGAEGTTASEISGVLETATSGGRLLKSGLAELPLAIKGDASSQWFAPNRVWVGKSVAKELSPVYLGLLKKNYVADGALVDFSGAPEAARTAINQWAATATQNQIAQLLPAGSIKATSKMVLTNAAYFKGQWSTPFDAAKTRAAPFYAEAGTKEVATMHGTVSAKEGLIDNIYVLELGFDGGNFSMLLALPPLSHTVQALENDVMGADIAAWSSLLKPQRVSLALPKFDIKGGSVSLNEALQAVGMKTAFGNGADFSGILKGNALTLDSIFHSAALQVNEEGTTASAATAAVVSSKSLQAEPPLRAFNRPFVFVLLHKPTGAPLFIGRVAQP